MKQSTVLNGVLMLCLGLALPAIYAQNPANPSAPNDPSSDQPADTKLVLSQGYMPPLMEDVWVLNTSSFLGNSVPFVSASGGQAPYTFTWSGLPKGVTISGNGPFDPTFTSSGAGPALFDGTPAEGTAASSPYTVTFTVTDANGVQASINGTLVVLPTPESAELDAPSLVFMGSTELVKGKMNLIVPATPEQWEDSPYNADNKKEDWYIGKAPTLTAVQDAEFYATGGSYRLQAAITGGSLPYQSIQVTGLPDGMEFTTDGFSTVSDVVNLIEIGGAPTTTEQADQGGLFFEMVPYLVTVLVTDADGRTAEASIGFGVNPKVNVVTDFFPSAFTQTAYELKLEASGGVGKHTWSGLNVPEGLAVKEIVNVSTNLITNEQTIEKYWAVSGIPYYTLPSGVHTFQLIATDSSTSKATAQKTSYILIEEGVPFAALDTPVPSIPDRMVEQFPAAITLDASGGIEPYTWAATSELPAGFALSSNGSQCTIEGALTDDISEVTTYTISLSLTDSSAPQQTVDVSFDISIEPGLEIITSLSQLPSATAGKAYSYEFAAPVFTIIGGVTPFDYAQSIALSELPKGLSFATSANGNLTLKGTPALTAAANEPYEIHPFVISDDQANGIHEEAGAPLSLMVEPAKLTMLNSVLPAGIAGQPYAVTLQGFGGIAPLTWTASGLPAGVTLKHDISTDTYSLAGTLDIESVGPYVISLSLTDSATKPVQVTTKLALIVSEPDSVLPLSIGVSSLPVATEGEQYGPVTLSATGGNAPYAWGESIGLPTGLSIAALANGSYIITGVPQVGSAAIYSVKLTVADSTSPLPTKASGVYTLVVLPALQSSSPDVAIPGQTLSDQVIAGAAAAGCSIQSQCSHVWFVIMLSMLGALCVATRRHEEESSMELLP